MKEYYHKQVKLLLESLPWVATEENFALKGGTAINLLVRKDFPRLSVDIDLTYLKLEDRNTSLSNIESGLISIKNKLESKINNISTVEVKNKTTNTVSKLEIQQGNIAIKIEPNLIIRGTVFPIQKLKTSDKVEEMYKLSCQNVPVVSVEDLYGGKICAALDRQHPRDLFDLGYILQNKISDKLKLAFIIYLISSNRPIHELLSPNYIDISKIYDSEFLGMSSTNIPIEELLSNRDKIIKNIRKSLNEKDKKFLMSVNDGSPDFSLVPIEHAQELPAIKWKIYNVKNMDLQKRNKQLKELEKVLYKQDN